MASELRVDTLKDSSGNNSVGMSTVAEGSGKVWGNLNGSGTIALRDSFNVASVVDNTTGQYDFNYTNNMNDGNYSAVEGTNASETWTYDTQTSKIEVRTLNSSGSYVDASRIHISDFGDLA